MDFNKVIDRRQTDSLKFDGAAARGKPEDILPLWVADMDFPAPEAVLQAVHERVAHGIFGYSEPDGAYFCALEKWFTGRLGYEFSSDWVTLTPGVVYAISVAIRGLTARGDAILIQEPVYYPFRQMVVHNGRQLVVNELQLRDKIYEIDFADFEEKITANNVKLFILCSPHNPVGRCWTADELREMVRICEKHNVLIFSDEIHCDFIFPDAAIGNKHRVLPAICPSEKIILCTAPSKTFNLAGLQLSNVFIAESKLRKQFTREVMRSGFSQAGSLAIVACRAAYEHGAGWLDELNKYLYANMLYLDEFLKTNIPTVRLIPPQATYLAWLDCRALNLTPDELDSKITNDAKLWLSRGDTFGTGGAGFTRINVGCPRETLTTCLERLSRVLG
ncbi:MAG: pyridoxal phosphate-dependent aminotransferase [Defluviitaleaceae bacterium]|nr:pyridoxal phosphate-dependent aminotransferase [Defluviitaleaceae bacterium]MCL2264328.1 pyridoxal phosphate-dependent aminotransferase [Defluviitaleaceae bacterium]